MLIKEMTQRECREMLAGTNIGRLACARNNQPYVVPIHVDLDGEFLYCYATLGQKIEWMRENPLVCLVVDELTNHEQWSSVVVVGRYEELPHTPEHEDSRAAAERLFQRHPMWWEPAVVPLAPEGPRASIVFRIRIARMTGRRATSAAKAMHVGRRRPDVRRPRWLVTFLRRVMGKQ